jgi:hypothetical protein
MQCHNCKNTLPPGVATCPICQAATPYNVSRPGNTPIDPTIAAPPAGGPGANPYAAPSYAGEARNAPIDPTVAAPGTPATAYGTPPPQYVNPYDASPPPYGVPSPSASPYGVPPVPAPTPVPPPGYGNPAPGAYNPYGFAQNAYAPPAYPGYGIPQQPPQRKGKVGLIIGIVAGALILLCVGASLVNLLFSPQGSKTPSGASIVPSAAKIITDPQTATEVDPVTTAPKKTATSFKIGSVVYVTFKLNLTESDVNLSQQNAYIQAKFYADGDQVRSAKLTLDKAHENAPGGVFAWTYTKPTQGAAELYWCLQSDCSDSKLAQVVTFSITS